MYIYNIFNEQNDTQIQRKSLRRTKKANMCVCPCVKNFNLFVCLASGSNDEHNSISLQYFNDRRTKHKKVRKTVQNEEKSTWSHIDKAKKKRNERQD